MSPYRIPGVVPRKRRLIIGMGEFPMVAIKNPIGMVLVSVVLIFCFAYAILFCRVLG